MKIANSLKLLFPAIVLIQERAAASTLPCNVTSWSIIGDEFNLRHSSCQEIPANGALKIAVPAGFDLSNSDIIKQKSEEGWALTKNGTRQITFTSTDKTDANQAVEITLSNANAPAHYIVPFHKKFTKFSRVVTKQRFDCAKCTAAAVDDASTEKEEEIAEPKGNWTWDWSDYGGNCKKDGGDVTIAPGSGGAKGVQVATCTDDDGFTLTLYCKLKTAAAASASDSASATSGTTLQSHWTDSDGEQDDGPVVTSGCSVITVRGTADPNDGQCCFS